MQDLWKFQGNHLQWYPIVVWYEEKYTITRITSIEIRPRFRTMGYLSELVISAKRNKYLVHKSAIEQEVNVCHVSYIGLRNGNSKFKFSFARYYPSVCLFFSGTPMSSIIIKPAQNNWQMWSNLWFNLTQHSLIFRYSR